MTSSETVLHDRYRIVAPIGEGGGGTVYLAEDLHLPGRRCAVKQLRLVPGVAPEASDAARARFTREAAVLARLDHPALPGVSDHFEDERGLYLVMDYVPGQDLRAVLHDARSRGRDLAVDQVLRWAEDLCRALTYLHRQSPPVVHRDIKPANVKLTPDGQLRLVDFGLAGAAEPADGMTVTVTSGGGTRPYQPLEQYGGGQQVDTRADLYALGATLYHLLTGHAPPSAKERFLDAASLTPPKGHRPDLSDAVARAVTAAMALHPDDRPPSAEALRRMLVSPGPDGLAASGGALFDSSAPRRADRTSDVPSSDGWVAAWRSNAWLLAVALMLLLVALALTVRPQ